MKNKTMTLKEIIEMVAGELADSMLDQWPEGMTKARRHVLVANAEDMMRSPGAFREGTGCAGDLLAPFLQELANDFPAHQYAFRDVWYRPGVVHVNYADDRSLVGYCLANVFTAWEF